MLDYLARGRILEETNKKLLNLALATVTEAFIFQPVARNILTNQNKTYRSYVVGNVHLVYLFNLLVITRVTFGKDRLSLILYIIW